MESNYSLFFINKVFITIKTLVKAGPPACLAVTVVIPLVAIGVEFYYITNKHSGLIGLTTRVPSLSALTL